MITMSSCRSLESSSNGESENIVPTRIINPYEGIDFDTTLRLRANLHTHTTASDGRETPDETVRLYAQMGYDIVAITDHRTFGIDATGYRMVEGRQVLVIKGIEAGRWHHHFNALFTSYRTRRMFRSNALIRAHVYNCEESLMFLNHPTRYGRFSDDWYVDVFSAFPADRLVGMEVVNADDRYPESLDLWDRVLTRMAPERAIWGFANDDSHNAGAIGFSFNEFLVLENNVPNIRYAMQNGRSFFYSRRSNELMFEVMPFVRNIVVNQEQLTITVYAKNVDSIQWISCGFVVSEEPEISVIDLGLKRYVRFVLTSPGGLLFSQPFLLPH